MPRLQQIRPTSLKKSPTSRPTSRLCCRDQRIHLYGLDSRNQIWHGPNELGNCKTQDKRLLHALTAAPGRSWYGPVNCCTCGEPATRFFALIHDLSDCAIASIYCDESKTGPAEVLAVLPRGRRARLREEFAFEFLAFARFLGSLSAGAELQVHEAMAAAIANEAAGTTCVFSISSGFLAADLDLALSCCAEKVATALCRWLEEVDVPSRRAGRGSLPAA